MQEYIQIWHKKRFDLNEAVVEEEANGGRSRDGCFFKPLRSDGSDKSFELRTFLGVVIAGELSAVKPPRWRRLRGCEEEEEKEYRGRRKR